MLTFVDWPSIDLRFATLPTGELRAKLARIPLHHRLGNVFPGFHALGADSSLRGRVELQQRINKLLAEKLANLPQHLLGVLDESLVVDEEYLFRRFKAREKEESTALLD